MRSKQVLSPTASRPPEAPKFSVGQVSKNTPKKLHGYRKYDNDLLQKAYEEAKLGKISARKAARRYGIPASTLRDRLSGNVDHDNLKNKLNLFNHEEESCLIEYLTALTYLGYPYKGIKLKEVGGQLANALKKKPNGKPLSNSWMTWFTRRWERKLQVLKTATVDTSDGFSILPEQVVQSIGNLRRLADGCKYEDDRENADINLAGRWFEMRLEQIIALGPPHTLDKHKKHPSVVKVKMIKPKPSTSSNQAGSIGQYDAADDDDVDDDNSVDDNSDDDSANEGGNDGAGSIKSDKGVSDEEIYELEGDSSNGEMYEDDSEVCCVCKDFSPPALANQPYVKLVKWAYCDKCDHCVHLAFCHTKRAVRKADSFLCPHCV